MPNPSFDPSVFRVKDPSCTKCQEEMDFQVFENYNDTGIDWLQWCCKNNSCRTCINVELV